METERKFKLTIGMASYKNFQEVWFTIQSLRLYQDLTDTELIIVDNYGDDGLRDFCASWLPNVRYERFTERNGTAAPRDHLFHVARGEWVFCIDSHVMLPPGTLARLREWCSANPDCRDLLQGPMYYDDLSITADAFNDEWAGQMWGTWRTNHTDPDAEPYEIPMMGLGLFGCRRDAWLGFNEDFRGFGGEEGYIHTKYRQAGRKTLCLPFLRWAHYFHTRNGVCTTPYSPQLVDKVHNYVTGFTELGLDLEPIRKCFGAELVNAHPLAKQVAWTAKITNIQIDTNANCGSKCWYCPVRYEERPAGQVMPMAEFSHILDEIQRAKDRGSVAENWTLWLSSYNDLLLDPLIAERLAELRRRGLRFSLLTNGIGLLKHARLISQYRDVIGGFSVNLPAGCPESYAAHTGNPPAVFNQIVQGLLALYAQDPGYYGQTLNVCVNGAGDSEADRAQIKYDLPAGDTPRQVEALRRWLPMLHVSAAYPLCDRAGALAPHSIDNGISRQATGCSNGGDRLTDWLHINSKGGVYGCCMDYHERYQFGNAHAMALHDIIVSPERRKMADEVRKDLCSKCTFSS